ncbi:tape measure protein [Deefgea piscis]|uniref:tape measure protein n=1 Tax=Deefgea piscis TaxID=2739061 RepID=UPI001C821E56|nr:tape measure protein [Deefgea piscis]QZA80181.1 hypothetical protein K4H25_11625 [Deefgea piscis]
MADNNVTIKINADAGGVEREARKASTSISDMARGMAGSFTGSAAAAANLNGSLGQMANSASGAFDVKNIGLFTASLVAAGVAAVGLAAGFGVGKLVSVEREFGTLNAQLETATGSMDAAKAKFAELEGLAGTLPESLQDVVGGFVKLKNLGLDPSSKAIASYANTAGALGKSLNEMIEAVADASTGEFERLKEFGIKASKQGDSVKLTFQGVTTTVKNNAQEIEGYLRKLGDVTFAGGAEKRMKTLEGEISNLGDTWDGVFRKINGAGVGSMLATGVNEITESLKSAGVELESAASSFSGWVQDNAESLGRVWEQTKGLAGDLWDAGSAIVSWGAGLSDALGGVDVLGFAIFSVRLGVAGIIDGFNLVSATVVGMGGVLIDALVAPINAALQGIGNLASGFAKVLSAGASVASVTGADSIAAGFNKASSAVGSFSVATLDVKKTLGGLGQSARDYADGVVDSFGRGDTATQRLINGSDLATEALKKTGKAADDVTQPIKKTADASDAAAKAMKKAADAAENFGASLSKRLAEDGLDEFGKLRLEAEKIAAPLKNGAVLLGAWNHQIDQLMSAKFAREEIDRLSKAFADAAKSNAELVNSARDEAEQFGLSKVQIAELTLAKKELLLVEMQREANMGAGINSMDNEQKLLKDQIKAMKEALGFQRDLEGKEVTAEWIKNQADAAQKTRDEWQKTSDSISTSITDALMRGFEDGKDFAKNFKDTLVNMFKSLVLQPIIKMGVQGGLSAVGLGSLAGTANASAGGVNLGGMDLSGLITKGIGGIASLAGASASGIGGIAAGASVAGQGATLAASSMGSLASSLGSVASTLGTVMPYVGVAIAAYTMFKKFEGGETRSGTDLAVDAAGSVRKVQGPSGGDFTQGGAANQLSAMVSNVNGILAATGSQLKVASGYGALETSKNGKGFAYAGGVLSNGVGFGNVGDNETLRQVGRGSKTAEQAAAEYTARINDAMVSAIAASDAPNAVKKIIANGGASDAVIAAIGEQANAVAGFGAVIGLLPMAQLSALTYDAKAGLLGFAGGLENLTGSLKTYYDNFYTDAEKSANVTRNMTDALSAVGVKLPETREAFRAVVEAQDLTTESGQKAYAALLGVSGAFAELHPIINAVDESATAAAAALELQNRAAKNAVEIATERFNLEGQLLAAQGNTVALRERELAAISASNRAIQNQIYALQDQKAATDAAMTALEQSANAEKAAVKSTLDGRLGVLNEQKNAEVSAFEAQKAIIAAQNSARLEMASAQLDAQKAAYQAQIDGAKSALSALKSVFNGIQSAIDRLSGSQQDLADMQYEQAKAAVAGALQAAKSGTFTPSDALNQQLDVVSRIDANRFSSAADFAREQLVTAGQLRELGSLVDAKISTADQQVVLLEQSVAAIESQGRDMKAAFEASAAAQFTQLETQHKDNLGKLDTQIGLAQNQYDADITRLDGIVSAAREQLEIAQGTWTETKSLNASTQAFNASLAALLAQQAQRSAASDARLAQLAALNAELIRELQGLRSDQAAQSRAIAESTQKTAKVLARWDGDGQPEVRAV